MNNKPIYSITNMDESKIVLHDMCNGQQLSVTNGAEYVIENLDHLGLLANRRVFYYDTEGQLDELLVRNGRFAGFAPGPR